MVMMAVVMQRSRFRIRSLCAASAILSAEGRACAGEPFNLSDLLPKQLQTKATLIYYEDDDYYYYYYVY